jgi:hypothetical protein
MLRATGLVLILVGALTACRAGGEASARLTAVASTSPTANSSPAGTRPGLPADFPVLPGAVEIAPPLDDLAVAARWTTDQVGTVAFDFYSAALPAAGYAVEGSYPGGEWAAIRFTGPAGRLWQLVIHELDLHTAQIEVRIDRP